jgi:hypothetical protein
MGKRVKRFSLTRRSDIFEFTVSGAGHCTIAPVLVDITARFKWQAYKSLVRTNYLSYNRQQLEIEEDIFSVGPFPVPSRRAARRATT